MGKWARLLVALLLTGCSTQSPEVMDEPAQLIRHTKSFDSIHIEGPFDVALHTDYRHSGIILRSFASQLPQIETKVRDDILYVSCLQNCDRNVRTYIQINTRNLHSFWYKGSGEILGNHLNAPMLNLFINNPGDTLLSGHLGLKRVEILGGGHVTLDGVHSAHLDLKIKGNSKVQLSGNIHLGSLILENGSWVSLYWIKADQLKLRVHGKTVIQMAGMTRLLDVELWGASEFRGRYLKANETFIKTHDHAIAEIATINHQHTLATDSSDIYFYRIPDTKANYMAYDGSVLDMKLFDPKLNAFNL